ncbi:hypothetical protein FF38_12791 [Lucilia cuprina]|uniref:Amidase domain-containing protein n=1 Tax=Lucilia cuprina TaxID=7375 RepID=A0A0L0CJA9_LUCCU|nr:hypothetical protein FF38_12791 [Lucilia cuprina]
MSLLLRVLGTILNIIAIVVNYIANLLVPRIKPTFPPIRNPVLKKSITELREDLIQKKLTSQELVQIYIERIKEVNASLNAVVQDRFEEAIKDAQHADSLISKADNDVKLLLLFQRYPLLGIPFTVKESCGLKGLSFSVGSLKRQHEVCPQDSEVVGLVKAAGGIPLLVSANPEFCFSFEADTHVNGKCLNPYDLRRTSGGSSSGEGSLNGAGATTFGVASDVSGSIRLPSLFCGVFGHKPTGDLVSVQGHFPYSNTDAQFADFLQMGPITRFAQDLPLLMKIMAGKNAHKLKFEEGVKLDDIKIFYTYSMGNFVHIPADFEIKLAITRAVKCFEKGGLYTEQVNIPGFQSAVEMTLSHLVSLKGIPSVITHSSVERPTRLEILKELCKSLTGYSKITAMPIIVELMIEMNAFLTNGQNEKLKKEMKELRKDLIQLLGTNGVLFIPTYHKSAGFFNGCSVLNISGVVLMLMFNILGFPATHVPMGLDRRGMPIGFQVVAAPYMDKLCLQIAAELEGAFGGWKEPLENMEFFLRLIQFMVKIVYLLVYFVLNFVLPRKKEQTIPPIKNKLLTLSLVQLVQRLRLHQLTSKELVEAYIERIREVNPYVNAVIEERFEEALKDAERADNMLNKCPLDQTKALFTQYPILGIPFTVKESCGLKGMSYVIGSLERVNKKAPRDCTPVENFRSAGGIPLLVSSNPEYCFSIETNTFTNGRCLNPYDFRRTCGGSSGGEGALHGSGASLFGIGSDIAGSIRIPSLFNGVFGHKPTGGLISNQGHFPNSDDPDCLEYLQMGPITRFGRDLGLLLQIMVGKEAHKLELLAPVETKDIKVFYWFGFEGLNGFLHQSVAFDIQLSIMKAVKYFEKKGSTTEPAKIKHFRHSTEIAMTGIGRLKNFPYLMRNDNKPPTVRENLKELIKSFLGYSKYTKEALIFELMRSTNVFMPKANNQKYEAEAKQLKQEIVDLLGSNGVLFFPTFHVPAIHHNTSVFPLWGIDYCLIFNVLGLPCTHIPMGLDSNGLPIGFQVVAAPMRDKLCLQVAGELEQGFGGWVPPTKHDFK